MALQKVKMTVDSANKRVKLLMQEVQNLAAEEQKACTYSYSAGEEPFIPEYDFETSQKQKARFWNEIIAFKHAINVFNTTHVVPGTDMTVDQALVRLPILTKHVECLQKMRRTPSKERYVSYNGVASYTIRNFNNDVAEQHYNDAMHELQKIRQGLSKLNLTSEIEVEIDVPLEFN